MDDLNIPAAPRNGSSRAIGTGSGFDCLFQLTIRMFERRDQAEILRLAMESVPTLGPYRAVSAYLQRDQRMIEFVDDGHDPPGELVEQLGTLDGEDGSVAVPGAAWARAFCLKDTNGTSGYLVVTAKAEPGFDELFLLSALAQQTGAAVANAWLHQSEREHSLQLARLSEELTVMNQRLTEAVADLQRRQTIHDAFTHIVASGGREHEIATTLHELTGCAVAIEDRFGNVLSWAGSGKPDPYPKPNVQREAILQQAATCDGLTRDRGCLFALARSRHEILGVIVLVDPGPAVRPHVRYALEHAATALELRLSHERNLAEIELRLRRDLVEDLISGTSDPSVFARSEAVGHDLRAPHYAVATQWPGTRTEDQLAAAVRKASRKLGMSILLARRPGMVVLFSSGRPDSGFFRAVAEGMGTDDGAIGVGAAAMRRRSSRGPSRRRCVPSGSDSSRG
jgi:hypothetical protein